MSKRIYTFEVEIDDAAVHESYEDGTCDCDSFDSCEDSIADTLNMVGHDMGVMARRGASLFDQVHFIQSYSEIEWDDLIHRPAKDGIAAWNSRYE